MSEEVRISLVEQIVIVPIPELEGWTFVRVEYRSIESDFTMEQSLWLPPWVDRTILEELLNVGIR